MIVLRQYSFQGFRAFDGSQVGPCDDMLRRHGLLDDVQPDEWPLLIGQQPTGAGVTAATWRCEAVAQLRWALGLRPALPVGGQLSMPQALSDNVADDELLTAPSLRPERQLRREMELWFVVNWRLRLREFGVAKIDLRAWAARSPYLTVLGAEDLPLLDDDLSLDANVMEIAADDCDVDTTEDWPVVDGRIPIGACTERMLGAGEDVRRVAAERLRALRWLFSVTPDIGRERLGLYRPDSATGRDKAVLYGNEPVGATGDVDGHDASGGLALHRAAWRGDLAALSDLHAAEADTMVADIDGDLPAHCAVHGGQSAALRALLVADPVCRIVTDADERLPLHVAAALGDIDCVDQLVGPGVPVPTSGYVTVSGEFLEMTDAYGMSPLRVAVAEGRAAVVDRLIELGASTEGALDVAIEHDRPAMIGRLVGTDVDAPDRHGQTAMYRAIARGRVECATTLLDLGAEAAYTHDSGTTALHFAADHGATDACLRLLDGGADLNRRCGSFAAVHFAIQSGHSGTALALIERGADTSGCDSPLLSLAVEGGSAELVRWCIDNGESPADVPGLVRTCAATGRADILRALADAGASPDDATDTGVTALGLAADRGHPACVEALLAAGATVGAADGTNGYTPLHLAAMHGQEECVRLLLAAGATRDTVDAVGQTAQRLAAEGGFTACATLLD